MISVPPTEEYQMDLSETFIFGNNSPSRREEEEERERGKFEFLLGEIGGQPEAPKRVVPKGHLVIISVLFLIYSGTWTVCTSIFKLFPSFGAFMSTCDSPPEGDPFSWGTTNTGDTLLGRINHYTLRLIFCSPLFSVLFFKKKEKKNGKMGKIAKGEVRGSWIWMVLYLGCLQTLWKAVI